MFSSVKLTDTEKTFHSSVSKKYNIKVSCKKLLLHMHWIHERPWESCSTCPLKEKLGNPEQRELWEDIPSATNVHGEVMEELEPGFSLQWRSGRKRQWVLTGTREVEPEYKEKHFFLHEDSEAVKQATQKGCAVSVLGGFQSQEGEALSSRVWSHFKSIFSGLSCIYFGLSQSRSNLLMTIFTVSVDLQLLWNTSQKLIQKY